MKSLAPLHAFCFMVMFVKSNQKKVLKGLIIKVVDKDETPMSEVLQQMVRKTV